MVEEVVLAHRAHVGDEPFAGLHPELLQRDPLPLRRRLDDLRVDRVLAVVVRDVERDGPARAVAVEVVVHAALGVDDERDLDPHEVQLAAEAVLDVPLDGRDRALRLLRVEKRRVVVRQDLLQLLVVADARTGEVGLLVENFGLVLRHGTFLSMGPRGETGSQGNMVPAGRRETGADASEAARPRRRSPMIRAHEGGQPCPAPSPRCPLRERRSRSRAGSSRSPTGPSSPSSRVTGRARTSGAPPCAFSTPLSRRPTAARGRSSGWRSTRARRRSTSLKTWLPDETIDAFREYLVGIKGPLTTPIGGGIRSLNVALRQVLDLYVCLRPVRWFQGVPSPVRHPEKVNMVIFRENTEDIYAGIEFAAGTDEAQEGRRVPEGELPGAVQEAPLPRDDQLRREAHLEGGQRASHSLRDPVRDREQEKERHVRPQGQHHEVHGRRLPELRLRPRRERVQGPDVHLGPVGADEEGEGRGRRERRAEGGAREAGRSSSRTRSPTSRSSRCSRVRTSSTSSRR